MSNGESDFGIVFSLLSYTFFPLVSSLVRGYAMYFPTYANQPDFDFPSNCVDVCWISILAWKLYICKVRLVTDKIINKPRGYAFVEYVHTRDMKNAYKQADGRKLDNKRVLVDVERGRTVPNWRPRRLGGGLGSNRIGGESAGQKHSNREQQHALRPRSEEPRRDDWGREKSRERAHERDRDERTHDRSHDHDSREERYHHRDRERTQDKDRERDRERGRGRDRRDRERHMDHGRDYEIDRERERSHDRHRGRDRDRDYERDRGRLHERDAGYDNGEPRHDRNLADYGQDYGYNQYEQHKSHEAYGYGQDGHWHETERSKRREREYYRDDSYSKIAANNQAQPNNAEPEAREEGEAYQGGDHQYHRIDEYRN